MKKRAKDLEGSVVGVEPPASTPRKRKSKAVKDEEDGDDAETPTKKPRARVTPKKAKEEPKSKAAVKDEHVADEDETEEVKGEEENE